MNNTEQVNNGKNLNPQNEEKEVEDNKDNVATKNNEKNKIKKEGNTEQRKDDRKFEKVGKKNIIDKKEENAETKNETNSNDFNVDGVGKRRQKNIGEIQDKVEGNIPKINVANGGNNLDDSAFSNQHSTSQNNEFDNESANEGDDKLRRLKCVPHAGTFGSTSGKQKSTSEREEIIGENPENQQGTDDPFDDMIQAKEEKIPDNNTRIVEELADDNNADKSVDNSAVVSDVTPKNITVKVDGEDRPNTEIVDQQTECAVKTKQEYFLKNKGENKRGQILDTGEEMSRNSETQNKNKEEESNMAARQITTSMATLKKRKDTPAAHVGPNNLSHSMVYRSKLSQVCSYSRSFYSRELC